jgi:endo-1,4-beta-xylanase
MIWNRRRFIETAGLMGIGGMVGCAQHKLVAANGPQSSPSVDGDGSLKVHAATRGLLYGCAVNVALLGKDEAYTSLVQQQAGIVVAENSMKWGPMRPSPTMFHWDEADKLVAFAEANGMKVRGHNLCWHRQLPRWFEGYASKENARGLLVEHIQTVAGRYAGRIRSWDVVNEAVEVKDGRSDALRESPWLKLAGPQYIEVAYRVARDADPKAKLTYNDYGIEGEDDGSARKRAAVLALVRGLRAKALVDAVGVQSHIGAGEKFGRGLTDFLAEIQAMGLEIELTEMDVNDRHLPADAAVRDKAVAATCRDYLGLALRNPAMKTVLTWGITDAHTWLNGEDAREDHLPERCLPFDAELNPVDAFWAIRGALDEAVKR